MVLNEKKALERELNELKKSYRDILKSNIKLSDEIRWAKEDKKRLTRRIDRAIEYINQFVDYLPEKDKAFNLLEILKNDFWEDDEWI